MDLNLVKGFLFEPKETFNKVKDSDFFDAYKYFAVLALIFSVLVSIIMASVLTVFSFLFGAAGGILASVFMFLGTFLGLLIGAPIAAAIFHIFVYIVGGRNGVVKTVNALLYASTPSLVFGWIPVIGLVATFYSFILGVIGLREFHGLTTLKAVAAYVLAILVFGFLALFNLISAPPSFAP